MAYESIGKEGIVIAGCGILRREIEYLIEKNGWNVGLRLWDSALHVDFEALGETLEKGLETLSGVKTVVFYGACHPLMDDIVRRHGAVRTEGQNCIEMLLGKERFTAELGNGAFFLLEDWAARWREITFKAFGGSKETARDIVSGGHTRLLCIKTPISGDFSKEALEMGEYLGLSVEWTEAGLDNLEKVIAEAIGKMK